MTPLSHRLRALAAELAEDERTLASLLRTARNVLDGASDESGVASTSRELAALDMATKVVAILGAQAAKLKAVK